MIRLLGLSLLMLCGCQTMFQGGHMAQTPLANMAKEESPWQFARRHLHKGDFEKALAITAHILAGDPNNQDARRIQIKALMLTHRLDSARNEALKLVGNGATNSKYLFLLSDVLLAGKKFDEGIAFFKSRLQKDTNSELYLSLLLQFYRRSGQFDEAIKTCRKILSRSPGKANVHKELALIYFELRQFELVKFSITQASQDGSKNAVLLNLRGLMEVAKQNHTNAAGFFKAAIEADAEFTDAYLNYGTIALQYHDFEKAKMLFSQAFKQRPLLAQAHFGLGFALSGQRNSEKAVARFAVGLRIQPNYGPALSEMTLIYFEQLQNQKTAAKWLKKYLKQNDNEMASDDPLYEVFAVLNQKKKEAVIKNPSDESKLSQWRDSEALEERGEG